MDELIPLDQVQKRLDLSRTSVWKLRQEGRLPTVCIGRRRYVKPEALRAFIESLKGIDTQED